jgi:hypothetical protein
LRQTAGTFKSARHEETMRPQRLRQLGVVGRITDYRYIRSRNAERPHNLASEIYLSMTALIPYPRYRLKEMFNLPRGNL